MKGKKVADYQMKKDPPAQDDLLAVMVGSTGNLRAPTIVSGRTVLVGFNREIYDEILGPKS